MQIKSFTEITEILHYFVNIFLGSFAFGKDFFSYFKGVYFCGTFSLILKGMRIS